MWTDEHKKNVFHAHAYYLFSYMLVIFKAEDFGWHFHLFSLLSKIVSFKNEYHWKAFIVNHHKTCLSTEINRTF